MEDRPCEYLCTPPAKDTLCQPGDVSDFNQQHENCHNNA